MDRTETHKGTILIVDDTPTNLGVLFEQLDQSGFRVLLAQDGENAIRQAQADQPDIILLDVVMPVIDGFETCRRLKAIESTRDIPVIFMTVLTDVDSKIRGFEAGGVDYVTKPVDWQEVLARVSTHLTLRNLHKSLEKEVTERRETQARLGHERNLLLTLINNIPDYIYVKDSDGRFVLSNTAYARAVGVTELAGKTEFEVRSEALAAKRHNQDQELLETGRPVVDFEEYERDNGYKRWLLTTKVPLRDSQGTIVGLVGISRDISERKKREESLRDYTKRLQILHRIDREILAGRSPTEVAQSVLAHIREFIPCQRASVLVFNDADDGADKGTVIAVHTDTKTNLGVGASVPLHELRLDALRHGRIKVDILSLAERSSVEEKLLEEDTSSYVSVPLAAQDELLGILNMGAKNPDVFTTSRLTIAEEVAVPLAIAIQQARLQRQKL